ncbi:MAG TPA: CBS domain-containing protein [Atribacter sp.]|uniref:CBS domain protein n=1 Tax=Candidatus Atribacter allofermentans TaxID=1852833 RepID=A0A1V5T3B7_9BACT|nr:CBS domain-containing protein [Atribacter sp.]MDD3714234.1 CBS domain-containing protein [Atribacterota bacterium]OQA61124.1 MAG: CBS domain protein [Candidatus Atribacteria bacterium ADurb.Bin276]HHT10943.1 CBS domain-containing protein [Candidatus Atribacteria bacterium]MDI9595333.1 CBS domain-containing protein [Atribacterota bacterium]HOT05935.1 CBS domain-containing protein [Atribacter sp.]
MFIEELMIPEAPTVNDFDTVGDTIQFLNRRKLSGVPVVDLEQNLVGYFSGSDFFNYIESEVKKELGSAALSFYEFRKKMRELFDKEVSEFLSEKSESLEVNQTEEDAIHFFLQSDFESVPVVRMGKVVGMLSKTKLLQVMLENK